jgi:hypothetical protein
VNDWLFCSPVMRRVWVFLHKASPLIIGAIVAVALLFFLGAFGSTDPQPTKTPTVVIEVKP